MDDVPSEDYTIVYMHSDKLIELGLASGDFVLLKGKKRTSTIATVEEDDSTLEGRVKLSKTVRSNLRYPILLSFIFT